jgi:hypothetical protein
MKLLFPDQRVDGGQFIFDQFTVFKGKNKLLPMQGLISPIFYEQL